MSGLDKQSLDLIRLGALIYNNQRLCKDFQEQEVLKFVEWLYKECGYTYYEPRTKQ